MLAWCVAADENPRVFLLDRERLKWRGSQAYLVSYQQSLFSQNFSEASVWDGSSLLWASKYYSEFLEYILLGKLWWHVEGMDVNVFMNRILLWNKSWWTVSLKYLQCSEWGWEILSEQVLRENENIYKIFLLWLWKQLSKNLLRPSSFLAISQALLSSLS